MAATDPSPGLTDTDILIDAARGSPQAVPFLSNRQTAGTLQVSIISAMELRAGCRDKAQLAQVQQFLAAIRVVPISEPVSRAACHLMESFYLSHGLLLPDALIGATCLEHRVPLHTKNVRHFQMITGLTAERPY